MTVDLAHAQQFSYESMGTHWGIKICDELSSAVLGDIEREIKKESTEFDQAFSRFITSSLIWQLTEKRGVIEVPRDLVTMLKLYEKLFDLSDKKCNPLIGFSIADMGYDDTYSLIAKPKIRPTPNFHDALEIIDDEHIKLNESVLIDIGALGKGFFVDRIAARLHERGLRKFLVDGSGDIFYSAGQEGESSEKIRAGLEHPADQRKVIGVLEISGGSLCGSAINRRAWGNYNHVIDPETLTSSNEIIATWVWAPTAAVADGLATCLFFTDPEPYQKDFHFEYCILNKDYQLKNSAGFTAEFF